MYKGRREAESTNHVKGIGGKGERVGDEAADEFKEEEGRINSNHDLDACALGERHLGSHGGLADARARVG